MDEAYKQAISNCVDYLLALTEADIHSGDYTNAFGLSYVLSIAFGKDKEDVMEDLINSNIQKRGGLMIKRG